MLPGEELRLSARPAPEGFVRIPAGPYLGELRQVPVWPLRPDGTRQDGDGYFMCRTEVSVAEYRDFLIAIAEDRGVGGGAVEPLDGGPLAFSRYCSEQERSDFSDGCPGHRPRSHGNDRWSALDLPAMLETAVRFVSWHDALAYARFRDEKMAKIDPAYLVRIPTKSEWEKAGRGVDGRPFPWGFVPGDSVRRVAQGGHVFVTSYPELASPYGVLQMGTSVAEWTLEIEGRRRRVVLGRTWDLHTDRIHLAIGMGEEPDYRDETLGFRVMAEKRR